MVKPTPIKPKPTTPLEAIAAWLRDIGADGLCNQEIECGCGIDSLVPCDTPDLQHCLPAKRYAPGECKVPECEWVDCEHYHAWPKLEQQGGKK